MFIQSYSQDVLSHYARDKRNLIIDSPNPFLTPHIVITPPDHPHDGYWAFVENGVGPQSEPNSLLVPPIVQGSSIVWPPWQERHYNWYTAQIASYALPDLSWSPPALDVAIDERNPLGVFSLTRFEYEVRAYLAFQKISLTRHLKFTDRSRSTGTAGHVSCHSFAPPHSFQDYRDPS